MRKGESDLVQRLDRAVDTVVHSERFKKIYSHWYAAPAPYWNTQRTILSMSALLMLVATGMLVWRYRSLQNLNRRLTSESEMRRDAENQLQHLNADLKETVRRQTEDLAEAQRMAKIGSWVQDLRQDSLDWR